MIFANIKNLKLFCLTQVKMMISTVKSWCLFMKILSMKTLIR